MKDMVAKLLPECHYAPTSIPGVVFGHSGIRQHILDTLNERRRVHQGYYFEQVNIKSVEIIIYLTQYLFVF